MLAIDMFIMRINPRRITASTEFQYLSYLELKRASSKELCRVNFKAAGIGENLLHRVGFVLFIK